MPFGESVEFHHLIDRGGFTHDFDTCEKALFLTVQIENTTDEVKFASIDIRGVAVL